jgi:hypothetical protein
MATVQVEAPADGADSFTAAGSVGKPATFAGSPKRPGKVYAPQIDFPAGRPFQGAGR